MGKEATRAATVRDFMFLADCMTTRRLAYEKPDGMTQENWLAYKAARDELQAALVSGVVDFCEACHGIGERPQTVGYPPDDYWDEVLNCPDCNGSGNAATGAAPRKLWLWKNFADGKPEYWAFDNPYPINLTDGDPQTLGEPCGYALLKPSRVGRTDVSEERVIAAIFRAQKGSA